LKGEELGWFRLASHLKMSVGRCQEETTSSQFVMWMEYLNQDVNAFHRENYYWAQIAWIIARVFGGDKNSKVENYILEFKNDGKKKKLTAEQEIKKSKSFWQSLVGLKRKK